MASTIPAPALSAAPAMATPLWVPPSPETTRTHAFIQKANNEIDPDAKLQGYSDLYAWSVGRLEEHRASQSASRELGVDVDPKENGAVRRSDSLQKFWRAVWDETGVVGEKGVTDGVSLEVSATVPLQSSIVWYERYLAWMMEL